MMIKKRWIILFAAYIFALGCLLIGMQGLVLELASTAPIASADAETSPVTSSACTVTLSAAKTDASHTDAANAGALSSVARTNAHPAGDQKAIAKKVLRLHIIANSDSAKDQNLKLFVRDQILHLLQNDMKEVHSASEAKKVTQKHLTQIQTAAQKALVSKHCNASVKVVVGKRYFPVKQYGDLTFPAGTYDALCIEIGKADGHNWWCVLFPSLCFVDETTAVVPQDSKEKLQSALSEEDYNSLLSANRQTTSNASTTPAPSPGQKQIKVRFGIADWIHSKVQ